MYTDRKKKNTHTLISTVIVRQTVGINPHTDPGDEDACVHDRFDVLQPA